MTPSEIAKIDAHFSNAYFDLNDEDEISGAVEAFSVLLGREVEEEEVLEWAEAGADDVDEAYGHGV